MMIVVLSCDGEPHRVEVDGASLRLVDHPDADESGVCPAARAAWARGAWCDELPEPLAEAVKARWAAVGVTGRFALEQARGTFGGCTPEELAGMVAALGEPSEAPWRELQRWTGVMQRKLSGADVAALASVKDRVRPAEAAEWQAACGHLPALEELAQFAELGVGTGSDAWKWARALGTTIDPAAIEHVRTMGFRHGEDLYGWGQLLGVPPGGLPGPDELDQISSLRGVGIRRPRHAALWVERFGRVPTAADVRAAPVTRLRVRARLVAEIATAGGPLIPFGEGPEYLLLLLCLTPLVLGLTGAVLEAFTHYSRIRVTLEAAVVTFVIMVLTQLPTPNLGYGYGRIPWKSPPGSDAAVVNGR